MIISSAADIPAWVALIVCVIILGAAFICSMAADIARDEVERVETVTKINTTFMNSLKSESAALVALADDSVLKTKLEKLAEAIRFSDPVSSEAIEHDETVLSLKFGELSKAVSDGADNASALCDEVTKLLNVRNAKCKANK